MGRVGIDVACTRNFEAYTPGPISPKGKVYYVHRHGFEHGVFSETHTKFVHAHIAVIYRTTDVLTLELRTRGSMFITETIEAAFSR